MSLWNRAPREVYRVYGEDEYLAGEAAPVADSAPGDGSEPHAAFDDGLQPHAALTEGVRPHPGRLLGLALLIGVTVGTFGLIVWHVSRSSGVTHPGAAGDVAHDPRSDETRQGSLVGGASITERASAAVSAASVPEAPRQSKIIVSRGVTSAHVLMSSRGHGEPGDSVEAHSPSCCVWAQSPKLRMSSSNLPAEAVASPSLNNEFGFER